MANELKFGNKVVFLGGQPLTLPTASSDPGSATNGDLYYNSSTNKIRLYQSGSWTDLITSAGAGASTALDNLSSVAINTSLLPGVTNSINLGSASFDWAKGYIRQLQDSSDLLAIDAYGRELNDGTAAQLRWSTSGVEFTQLTANTVPYIDGDNLLVSSSVTGTELGYLSGVTSGIQSQLGGKAATDLSNLASVAINTSLISDTDNTDDLGSDSIEWKDVWAYNIKHNSAGTPNLSIATTGNNGNIVLNPHGTGVIDVSAKRVTNAADPTSAQDLATKAYVDTYLQGLEPKGSVRVASLANVNISNALENGDTLDGVTLATGNRVLLKNQSDPVENGVYIVAASGAASRATDFDGSPENEVKGGDWVYVEEGTQAGTSWAVLGNGPKVMDTDPVNFTKINKVTALQAGDAITISSDVIDVNVDNSTIEINSNALRLKAAGITDSHINGSAAIALSKLASLTASRALVSDGSGVISASSVTATELGYLSGVTSAIQTQLGGKASTALDNLSSVAINTSLISDTDNTDDLGSDSIEWKDIWAYNIKHNSAGTPDLNIATTGNNGSVILTAHGTGNLDIKAAKVRRAENGTGSNYMEDAYFDALTLNANTGSATEISSSLSFAVASFDGAVINYRIKEATSNKVRIGQLIVSSDGSVASSSDQFSETAALGSASGLSLSADISGGNLRILYNNTHASNNATMRCHIRRFRA